MHGADTLDVELLVMHRLVRLVNLPRVENGESERALLTTRDFTGFPRGAKTAFAGNQPVLCRRCA